MPVRGGGGKFPPPRGCGGCGLFNGRGGGVCGSPLFGRCGRLPVFGRGGGVRETTPPFCLTISFFKLSNSDAIAPVHFYSLLVTLISYVPPY